VAGRETYEQGVTTYKRKKREANGRAAGKIKELPWGVILVERCARLLHWIKTVEPLGTISKMSGRQGGKKQGGAKTI